MKILLVNWSLYPSGGDWTYIDNVQKLYERHGHETIFLSTKNERNTPTQSPEYLINSPDYKLLYKNKTIFNGIKAIKNSIISQDALKKVDEILSDHKINIAHLHNIHHYITPAIIWKLKKANVKIIWSLHDYKIICPESLFISNGKICERCITGNFYNCTLHKCKRKSLAASTLASIEAYFYHKRGIYKKVDAYLCPSNFIKNKFLSFGFGDKNFYTTNLCYDTSLIDEFLINKNKTSDTSLNSFETKNDFIFYVGRIEKIKGVATLINAIKNTNIPLKVAGAGSDEKEIRDLVNKQHITNVELMGFKDKNEIFALMMKAKFVVCPSEWYENYPFSIIESFLFSKPVIGAKIGGIPELVRNGETGFLFESGNVTDLQNKITNLWSNDKLAREMGNNARNFIYDIVNFDTHWLKLHSILNHITSNEN